MTLRDCLFQGNSEHTGYNSTYIEPWHYTESRDHDQVEGAFRAWCRGGVVNSVSSPVFGSRPRSYQHVCESADYPVFRQEEVLVEPGDTLFVTGWFRKDASMSYLPRLQIVDYFADPLVDDSSSPLDEAVMTDSIDAWETLTVSWTNSGTAARKVLVRALAKNATGNLYEDFHIARIAGAEETITIDIEEETITIDIED